MARSDLYMFMKQEFLEADRDPMDIPSLETFLYVWRKQFDHLKIPRYNTLGSCDVCLKLKTAMGNYRKGTSEYRNLRGILNDHIINARLERRQQVVRDQDSANYPEISWTITTDFMQDLYMPWLAKAPKSW